MQENFGDFRDNTTLRSIRTIFETEPYTRTSIKFEVILKGRNFFKNIFHKL